MTRGTRTALATVCILLSVATHLWIQAGMLVQRWGWHPNEFRNFYWTDQLAYLGIATNVADGASGNTEPFTRTGTVFYPRAYYVLLGHLARWVDAQPATMWVMVGLLVQALLVASIGVTLLLLTRRWWSPLLAVTPFLFGTGAVLVDHSDWVTEMGSHAVLWGTYATMFTLNAETVALSIGAVSLLIFLLIAAERIHGRAAWVAAIGASWAVGATANVQTYGFLTTVYLLAAGGAALGLVRSRSRILLVSTIGLAAFVALAGDAVRDVSPLASLVLGVIPAAPGVVWVLRGTGWRGLWCVGAVVAGAAPPVLATVGGLLRHDPFLLYRESSTSGLGVPGTQGVIGAMGALALLAFVLAVGIVTRSSVWIALPIGLVVCWAWVAENDVWGANQEPYRFWLDGYVLVAVLAVPLVAWAAVETLGGERAGRVGRTSGPAVASAQDEGQPQMEVAGLAALPASAVRARRWVSVALVLVVGVTATWSVEFLSFRRDVADWGYVPLTHPFYRASNELLAQTGGEMVAVGGCIDTIIVKVTWGGPIAYYNRGLAWPDEKEAIDMVARARRDSDDFDAPLAVRAGLRWFLVDPACAVDMLEHADTVLVDERTIVLDGDSTPVGTVELRRLVDDGTTVAP